MLKFACAAFFSIATLIGAACWYAVAPPSPDSVDLPELLVDARSERGRAMLESTPLRVDYDELSPHFVAQARRGYCGVASATIVLNALGTPPSDTTQDAFFTARASEVRSSWRVTLAGMSLAQLADLLRAHDASVELHYAAQMDLATFRELIRTSVSDPSDFIVVNYDRAVLHQRGRGHISPVAAYHADADRVLILDVAAHRYPPTWVPTDELWEAMKHVDSSSGIARGFVVVSNNNRLANARASWPTQPETFPSGH
jgi:hypothetical protein